MSNLVMEMNEQNINGVVSEAFMLIRRLHNYTLSFFAEEQEYILHGLMESKMRDEILACYDDEHRPDVAAWNQEVMNEIQQLRTTGYFDIRL